MSEIRRYNATVLRKLAKLPQKTRKLHLKKWPSTAFKDIKNISKGICDCEKIPKKVLRKLSPYKKTIRKIARSKPLGVKKILVNQKGGGIFTVLAGTLLGPIIDAIGGLFKKK